MTQASVSTFNRRFLSARRIPRQVNGCLTFDQRLPSLQESLRFEQFFSKISYKFIDLKIDSLVEQLGEQLREVIIYFDCDQGKIVELDNDGIMITTTQKCGDFKILSDKHPFESDFFATYLEKLHKGEITVFDCTINQLLENSMLGKRQPLKNANNIEATIPLIRKHTTVGVLILHGFRSPLLPVWMDQFKRIGELFGKILNAHKNRSEYRNLYQFEQLVSEISAQFAHLAIDKIDEMILNGLERIGEFLEADRCTFSKVFSDKINAIYPWSKNGIPPLPKIDNPNKTCPWAHEKFTRCEIVQVPNLDDLPPEAAIDKTFWAQIGTKSLLAVPSRVDGTNIFAISVGFLSEKNVFSNKLFPRLKLLVEIFSNAVVRKQKEVDIQNAFIEIKELKKQLEMENIYLKEEISQEYDFENMIGQSKAYKTMIASINMVAPTDMTTLILGETGTGKELVARALHAASGRKDRPMLKVNCAAFSPTVIENELFGHEKGAYTTAQTRQAGRFEHANGSTLFFDEIGELPYESQAKLLRVLQEGEFERMGSSRTIKVDVRVIAATNRNLKEEVKNGNFREDLWYRLHVFPIQVPPLRNRRDDIPLLTEWFIQKFNKKLGKAVKHIPSDTVATLQKYPWPGNVRELENVIERAVINSHGNSLRLFDSLSPSIDPDLPSLTLEESERNHILHVLTETEWRVEGAKGAAVILGLNPSTLRSRMRKLGIIKRNHTAFHV